MSALLALLTLVPAALAQVAPLPPPPPVLDDAARAPYFTEWATQLASGNVAGAAEALVRLIDDPAMAPLHGEAFGHLGEIYEKQGLELAAIGAYGKGLLLDAPHNATIVSKALALVEKTGEAGFVGEAFANDAGIPVDPSLRNARSLMAARAALDRGNYGPAMALLMMGDSGGAGYEDVELLRGVALSGQGRHTDALAPFLTAQAMGVQAKRDERWQVVAALNLARAYYSAEDWGKAIEWYGKIPRESEWWLDAQFERAWAHFRGNDTNGALAMLFNHESPFFADRYQPEADLLRAYSYFVMCKFTDASKEMDAFAAKYEPYQRELSAVSLGPADAFEDVKAFRAGQQPRIPAYVLEPYRTEERFDRAYRSVALAEAELPKAQAMAGRPGQVAVELVTAQRDARVATEGKRVTDRVERAKAELADYLGGLEITKIDLLNLEAQMYERAAATGVLDYGAHAERLKELRKAKKGYRVWPWQGESWADELGWFVFASAPDCPSEMARGDQ